jgi:uncharacterized protein YndB with AHSA1/START domain
MIRPLHDPDLDLVLDRVVDVPPELVWKAWTEAEHLRKWFAPAPWSVADCRIDLRPGGQFLTVMKSPDGEEFPGDGCILEVVENRRFVFTDALGPGFRPAEGGFFTCILTLEPEGSGTRYVARAMHRNPEDRERHESMGFQDGWSTCLDQLVELVKGW